MNHLALFNGIGGFQLAAHWLGWNNIAHVEIDDKCNQVVKKHFPGSKCHTDIREFNGKEYAGTIDIISGGFPCQPFSVAGKQMGADDIRNLWPEMFRVIREVHPPWVVGENVSNLSNFREFENTLLDLENEGYEVQSFIIPAVSVGAWHKRDRIWIVAYADRFRRNNEQKENREPLCDRNRNYTAEKQSWGKLKCGVSKSSNVSNATSERLQNGRRTPMANTGKEKQEFERCDSLSEQFQITADTDSQRGCSKEANGQNAENAWQQSRGKEYWKWDIEPNVGRVANGVSGRVDRLKQLGNAIVPQVAYEIFKAIAEYENLYNEPL